MGLLGRKRRFAYALIAIVEAGMLLLLPEMNVQAADTEDMVVRIEAGQEEDYIRLIQDPVEYEVRPGDCLWDIAEEVWGDGSLYSDIVMSNQESISDADMIYPGMLLELGNSAYIKRQSKYGRIYMWRYVFYKPDGSTVGISEFGEHGSNFCLSGDGKIACLVQDKTQELVRTTSDWEACTRKLDEYAKDNYEGKIDEFSFEHYQSEKGEDIYLYSCRYQIDFSKYGYDGTAYAYLCVGMKMTKHIQAEFVGFDMDEGIKDSVRYVTASFEEQPGLGEYTTVNGSNMAIWEDCEWELDGMFNSLAWLDGCLTYLADKAMEEPEDQKETMTSKYGK